MSLLPMLTRFLPMRPWRQKTTHVRGREAIGFLPTFRRKRRNTSLTFSSRTQRYIRRGLQVIKTQGQKTGCGRSTNELKTWYDSMRTKLGKLKKAVTKSGQAADGFTATEKWIWQHFQFLSEHITQMPRRNVVSFNARLQPPSASASNALPDPDPAEQIPFACEVQEDAAFAGSRVNTPTSYTAGTQQDAIMGLLGTFLTQRQNKANPTTAFGCYVDSILRSLPPPILRKAESRIIAVLHECHNEAERQQLRSVEAEHTGPVVQRHMTTFGEPQVQRPAGRPREPLVRQWQPPPSQWPSEVTTSPSVWNSMDRPWVQQQFPEMNIICPTSISGNEQQPQRSPSTSAVEEQAISYSRILNSHSYQSESGHQQHAKQR